ncbi:hypothetical protein [Algoriphagus formosus]|uniref:hypothetical protein n=1 Tax=Algoriphagus formosus TaxID=2007308 RepID=UPI0012FE661A|nr:hypothetical protein [Algoriphagus formosus]
MNIRDLTFNDGKTQLVKSPLLGPVFYWMDNLIGDLTEDQLWEWLNHFYDVGPTEEQVEELGQIVNPENKEELDYDPHWKLWCAFDLIWQNNYDDWKSRGYNPAVTGGWYWRREEKRMQERVRAVENAKKQGKK